jgi:flavin-binding protein dodecin
VNELFIFHKMHTYVMSEVVKVIELVGSSERGWTEAAQAALDEASKTIKGITGLEVNDITAKVDPDSGKISQYRVGVKIAFKVERS